MSPRCSVAVVLGRRHTWGQARSFVSGASLRSRTKGGFWGWVSASSLARVGLAAGVWVVCRRRCRRPPPTSGEGPQSSRPVAGWGEAPRVCTCSVWTESGTRVC